MLRVIFWKIGCELAHLKRALSPQFERKVYYFAFGANLCRDVLEQRRIKVFETFDYVLEDASLQFLFTNVGLTGADMGAAYLLPRIVGAGRAYEILALGERVSAHDAAAMGLVNRVVPAGQVLETALGLANKLAQGPSLALGITKRTLVDEWSMDLESALESEAQAQALMMMGEDHRIFYEAFAKKEKPKFKGR